jgi:hypothetical protein
MALTVKEQKERREIGRQQAIGQMSLAEKVQRRLTNGRPPASELRTPHAALVAAKTLHGEIRTRIEDETHGQHPRGSDYFAVTVAYVSPDLSVLGFTSLCAGLAPMNPADEARIERMLTGNIAIGLMFGIGDGKNIVTGTRPFLVTKQTDAWFAELEMAVKTEFDIDRAERK